MSINETNKPAESFAELLEESFARHEMRQGEVVMKGAFEE